MLLVDIQVMLVIPEIYYVCFMKNNMFVNSWILNKYFSSRQMTSPDAFQEMKF